MVTHASSARLAETQQESRSPILSQGPESTDDAPTKEAHPPNDAIALPHGLVRALLVEQSI